MQAGDFNGALVAETLQELARKKQQMQLAQAREREQLLGISLSSGGRGGAAAGRNSNNSNNNNNNNNGYAGSAANAHQIRELKAKHRKVKVVFLSNLSSCMLPIVMFMTQLISIPYV